MPLQKFTNSLHIFVYSIDCDFPFWIVQPYKSSHVQSHKIYMIRFVQNEWHFYGVKNFVCREIGLGFLCVCIKNTNQMWKFECVWKYMREKQRCWTIVNCSKISRLNLCSTFVSIEFQKSYNLIFDQSSKKIIRECQIKERIVHCTNYFTVSMAFWKKFNSYVDLFFYPD